MNVKLEYAKLMTMKDEIEKLHGELKNKANVYRAHQDMLMKHFFPGKDNIEPFDVLAKLVGEGSILDGEG